MHHKEVNTFSLVSITFALMILFQWLHLIFYLRFWPDMNQFLAVLTQTFKDIWPYFVMMAVFLISLSDFEFFKYNYYLTREQAANVYQVNVLVKMRMLMFGDWDG